MCFNQIVMFALAMICQAVICKAFEADSCTYSFSIPAADCEVAPAINDELAFLVSIVQNQQATIQNQQSQMELLTDRIVAMESTPITEEEAEDTIDNGVGSTYVRWGRTVCPDGAQLVYEGYAGKNSYSYSGGGVDYQCLPKEPDFREDATTNFQSNARMYGVEYDDDSGRWANVHDQDVPCAVCSVTGRGRQLMIPAKLTCPDEWTLEYSGWLATEKYTHKGATYICVDFEMEEVNGGHEDKNGGLLYIVEAACGSLKCPPYQSGYEIVCSVCTR